MSHSRVRGTARDDVRVRRHAVSAVSVVPLAVCALLAACGEPVDSQPVPSSPATELRERAARLPEGSYSIRDGDLVYAYQLTTDSEALFDVAADPGLLLNLAHTRPQDVDALRRRLCERLGVVALRDLARRGLHWRAAQQARHF